MKFTESSGSLFWGGGRGAVHAPSLLSVRAESSSPWFPTASPSASTAWHTAGTWQTFAEWMNVSHQ